MNRDARGSSDSRGKKNLFSRRENSISPNIPAKNLIMNSSTPSLIKNRLRRNGKEKNVRVSTLHRFDRPRVIFVDKATD